MPRAIKYRERVQMFDKLGPAQTKTRLTEALDDGDLRADDFDFCELGEACFGSEFRRACDPNRQSTDATRFLRIKEAEDGLDYTAFLNITGRVISNRVMEGFNEESAIAPTLIDLETNVRLKNERRPGIQAMGDDSEVVHPGMPYPRQTLGEKYQDFADNDKRGLIVPITKECLFFVGFSGEILRQAGDLGAVLGRSKDRRCWNVILGIANNFTYGWRGQTTPRAYNTYNNTHLDSNGAVVTQAAVDARTAVPVVPQNIHGWPLNTWRDIDRAERLFDRMVNPDNGEPIDIGGATIIVMPAAYARARSIITATEDRWQVGVNTRITPNPASGYQLAPPSRRARSILNRTGDYGDPDSVWLLGDFKKAFVYRENWPLTVVQAPLNSEAEFEQDIVVRYKASERGGCWVKRPHYVVISSGSCGHSSSGETECTPDAWPGIDANAEN
jgi:hypothetical protein